MEQIPSFKKSTKEQPETAELETKESIEVREELSAEAEFRQEAVEKASEYLAEQLAEKEPTKKMVEAVAFHYFIVKKLCRRLAEKLIDIDYSKEEINTIVNRLIEIPERDAVSILALSDKQLDIFFTKYRETENVVQNILDAFTDADADKPAIGFHATPKQIIPRETISNGREIEEWVVKGSEKDHRDNDLLMAYYSYDYTHLYRQNKGDFLYIVQSMPSHRNDPSNNWGRAPKLEIIAEMKQKNIREYIEKMKRAAQLSSGKEDDEKERTEDNKAA